MNKAVKVLLAVLLGGGIAAPVYFAVSLLTKKEEPKAKEAEPQAKDPEAQEQPVNVESEPKVDTQPAPKADGQADTPAKEDQLKQDSESPSTPAKLKEDAAAGSEEGSTPDAETQGVLTRTYSQIKDWAWSHFA